MLSYGAYSGEPNKTLCKKNNIRISKRVFPKCVFITGKIHHVETKGTFLKTKDKNKSMQNQDDEQLKRRFEGF